jgi:hypothetical protein
MKDAILADAHVPPAQEMRNALTGGMDPVEAYDKYGKF